MGCFESLMLFTIWELLCVWLTCLFEYLPSSAFKFVLQKLAVNFELSLLSLLFTQYYSTSFGWISFGQVWPKIHPSRVLWLHLFGSNCFFGGSSIRLDLAYDFGKGLVRNRWRECWCGSELDCRGMVQVELIDLFFYLQFCFRFYLRFLLSIPFL